MKIKDLISDCYRHLLPSELLEFERNEEKATCANCLMAKTEIPKKDRYQPDLKCCTFEPFLPNYLVGGILENNLSGAPVVREKILSREYALPIGLVAPVRFQVEFNARKKGEFGNRKDWLCSYYDQQAQGCSIWQYRGVVCTSFSADQAMDGLERAFGLSFLTTFHMLRWG